MSGATETALLGRRSANGSTSPTANGSASTGNAAGSGPTDDAAPAGDTGTRGGQSALGLDRRTSSIRFCSVMWSYVGFVHFWDHCC